MKCLIVFDNFIKLNISRRLKDYTHVDLFPLVENRKVVEQLECLFQDFDSRSIFHYNSAELIKAKVDDLREGIGLWANDIGDAKVDGRSVKEWLVLPGLGISAWWLGLLTERNPMKTRVFLQIAQINAIRDVLTADKYGHCSIAVADPKLRIAVKSMAESRGIKVEFVHARRNLALKDRARQILSRLGMFGNVLSGLRVPIRFLIRSMSAKIRLKSLSQRITNSRSSLLFVSYFPQIDSAEAKKGIFINKYAYPLQEKLKKMGKKVSWLMMFVPMNQLAFSDGLKLMRKFCDKGERMFVLEEFFRFRDLVCVLWYWIRQIIVTCRVYHALRNRFGRLNTIGGSECEPLIKSLWFASFIGSLGVEGILYTMLFKRVFSSVTPLADCIYYAEMQAWEKALNAAQKNVAPDVRTIAYQHSAIPKNHFAQYPDKMETLRTSSNLDMPLPDVMACSGDMQQTLLESCGYQNMCTVEAVRYLHMNNPISSRNTKRSSHPVLLVAGSGDYIETRSILRLLSSAFPEVEDFKIVCKGHPTIPLEGIFDDIGVDPRSAGYDIQHYDIKECMESALAVLVSSSAVSIEALAYGCEVIVPVFPEAIMMNPLADFEGYCHIVTSSSELAKTMKRIINGYHLRSAEECRSFVEDYWCLDVSMKRWEQLLCERV